MTMRGKGVLALWLDVEPAAAEECDEWYVREHIPERIDLPGFRRSRRYAAVTGTPGYMAVYEADTAETLLEPGYRRISGTPTEWTRKMRQVLHNTVRSTLRVTASIGRGEGAVLGCLRFAPAEGKAAALRAFVTGELMPALLRQRCVVAVHLWENDPAVRETMDATRKAGSNDPSADWVLLFEATQPKEIEAAQRALLADGALAAKGAKPEMDFGLYRLLYTVSD